MELKLSAASRILFFSSLFALSVPLVAQASGDMPQSRVSPEPIEWSGQDQLFIQCTGCAEIRYKIDGQEKKYSGPITLPATGGELSFYGISAADIREPEKTFRYVPGGQKPWRSATLTLSPLTFLTLSGMKSALPTGFGGLLSFDQGFDGILEQKAREWLIPGLRIETGMIFFKKNATQELMVPVNAGPIWLWSPIPNHNGQIFTAPTFGAAFIRATAGGFSKSVVTSNLQWSAGYRYSYERMIFEAALRYGWFFDKDITLGGLGISLGVGYVLY